MKSILSILFIACISVASFAQGNAYGKNKNPKPPKETPEEAAKKRTDQLSAKINLTPEQYDKVYQLKLTRIQAIRNAKSVKPVNGQLIKDANKNYKEAIKQVLTPAQIQMLKEMKKDHKGKGHEKGHKGRGPKTTTDNPKTGTAPSPAPGTSSPSGTRDFYDDDEPDFDL